MSKYLVYLLTPILVGFLTVIALSCGKTDAPTRSTLPANCQPCATPADSPPASESEESSDSGSCSSSSDDDSSSDDGGGRGKNGKGRHGKSS